MPTQPSPQVPARSQVPASPQAPATRPEPPCPCRDPGPARPLPDPADLRLAAVPECAPPYDGQEGAPDGQERTGTGIPSLPQAAEDYGSVPAASSRPARLGTGNGEDNGDTHGGHRSGPQEGAGPRRGTGPRPGRPGRDGGSAADGRGNAARPPAGDWPSQFAQVLAETLAGSRPASQVTPWTTERARATLRRLGPLLAAGQRPRLRRLITSCPAEDVVEVAAVVGFGPRTRALAVRFERTAPQPAAPGRPARPARWLCTAIEAA